MGRKRTLFGCALVAISVTASARAGVITISSSAPAGATISQPDFSGPAFNGGQDFTDNAGPPGQTFFFAPPVGPPAPGPFFITAITVKGFANTGASFGGNVNTGTWTLTLSRVDTGNVLTRIAQETANPAAVTDGSAYVTFALDTPVPLALGVTQAFDLFSSNGYFGLAKSSTDVYSGGAAFQHGSTARTAADGATITNVQSVDRTFFINLSTTPEPGSTVILGIVGLATLTRRRRAR
jgi:hypothetical protein